MSTLALLCSGAAQHAEESSSNISKQHTLLFLYLLGSPLIQQFLAATVTLSCSALPLHTVTQGVAGSCQ